MVLSYYIYKLIEEGEHQRQDFKYCINDSKKIARSLVAFANTNGGRLLIGVKDNGKIVGISTDEEYYMVESAAKIFSEPPINFSTKQWQVEGKTVLEITIEPSEKKPHFAKDDNGKWLAYLRINDENVLAHKIQINVWKKQNSTKGIRFSYSDDEKFLIDFLHQNTTTSFSKYLRNANISRRKAENILTDFVLMDVVRMNTSKEGTIFKLNAEFDTNELQKFS
ncbi:MAG: ATP-binding protein [Prolixibacteraceae bacterium]|nr:ATP-binding protein [Prolixibacteraceae bacterium]